MPKLLTRGIWAYTVGMKDETKKLIADFTKERDWERFHTPKNLAISICLEAAELLENFQWVESEDALESKTTEIRDELADVLVYCEMMCAGLGLDQDEIVRAKMDKNRKKYPVGKSYGSCKKYNEL